jgi:hypothetical protein
MNIFPMAPGRRKGSRDDETTVSFERPREPQILPLKERPRLQHKLYFLAPPPWPKGQFVIDPEQ